MEIEEKNIAVEPEAAEKKITKSRRPLKKQPIKINAKSKEFKQAFEKFLKDVINDGGIMELSELEKFLDNFDYTLDDLDKIMDTIHKTDIDIVLPNEEYSEEDAEDASDDDDDGDEDAKDVVVDYDGDSDTADSIRMYLREIGKVPLLTQEEEIELAKRISDGMAVESWLKLQSEEYDGTLEEDAETSEEAADAIPDSLDEAQAGDGDVTADAALDTDGAEDIAAAAASEEQAEDDSPSQEELLRDKFGEMTDEELQQIIKTGEIARKRMAEANLRLVVSCAKRYLGRGMTFLDLIQEGNLGLLRAIDKFDYTRGFKFSTYATWWIKQGISRALADQSRNIRIPVHMVESINKLIRTTRRLTNDLHREPTVQELAEALDVPLSKVEEMRQLARDTVSLDTPIGDEEDTALGDFIEDDRALSPEGQTYLRGLKKDLGDVMQELTWREREVIVMRYGLDGKGERTLEAIGEMFDVTRERIRQIEAKAMKKLKHPTRSRKLKDYLH